MVTKCAECGKRTVMLYPDLWVYKRINGSPGSHYKYFCSWHCLRAHDKGEKQKMRGVQIITPEMEKQAIEIAIEGKSPIDYLKECGAKNPSAKWSLIRNKLKDCDPETYDRLPKNVRSRKKDTSAAEAMQGMKDAADDFFGACKDMGLNVDGIVKGPVAADEAYDTFNKFVEVKNVEIPEAPAVNKPGEHYRVTAIDVSGLGEFYYDRKYKTIDWRTAEGDEISIPPFSWLMLAKEIPIIMQKLGVEM